MSDTAWQVGMRVRLVKPDNPKHPWKGEVGEVIDLMDYPADPGWPKKGRPARTLLWVRYRRANWNDWVEKRFIDQTFGLYDYEVEATEQP